MDASPQVAETTESPILATRAAYVAACRALLGVRWVHQGRSPQGVDCVGLIVLPAIQVGLITADVATPDYQRGPKGDRLDQLLHEYGRRLPDWHEARPGDVLAVKYYDQPQHVMVITREWRQNWGFHVIHSFGSTEGGGGVIEHRLDSTWLKSHRAKIHAAFQFRGIE